MVVPHGSQKEGRASFHSFLEGLALEIKVELTSLCSSKLVRQIGQGAQ